MSSGPAPLEISSQESSLRTIEVENCGTGIITVGKDSVSVLKWGVAAILGALNFTFLESQTAD